MKIIITLFALVISIVISYGQEVISNEYTYDKLDVDLKVDFKNADFIIDYYYTEGSSLGDRYYYEIIVMDSILILKFQSPDFSSFNYLNYTKQIYLEPEEIDSFKTVIKTAELKQIKDGIAHWDGSMYTREVLIVKLNDLQIIGGQTYGPIGAYPDYEPEDKILAEIEKDRRESSSIGGDYDSVINLLNKYFTNIDALLKEAYKY